MISKPLVSICTVAFNHENYIEQMLQSILNQKINFDYELLIHDDASTDKTADIIKSYAAKYPNIIKPIFQNENQFSRGIRPNIEYNISRAKGKYLAFCDGDDFWCDSLKLQKQVDFLEVNSTFMGCSHNTKILRESVDNILKDEFIINNPQKDIYTIDDFIKGEAYFHTSAFVFRFNENEKNYILDLLKQIRGDWFRSMVFASFGPIKYIDEVMSVYRIHDKGVWSKLSEEEQVLKNLDAILSINKAFDYKYEENLMNLFTRVSLTSIKNTNDITEFFNNKEKIDLIKVIDYLYKNIKLKDQAIAEKDQIIADKDKAIAEKEQYIHEIHSSKIYKIMRLFKNLKLRGFTNYVKN